LRLCISPQIEGMNNSGVTAKNSASFLTWDLLGLRLPLMTSDDDF
jgi:hypothetical protein